MAKTPAAASIVESKFQAEQERQRNVHALCDQIIAIEPESLVRANELGDANFATGLPYFHRVRALAVEVRASEFTGMPPDAMNQAAKTMQLFLSHLQRVQQFTLASGNPVGTRDSLLNEMTEAWHTHIAPILNLLTWSHRKAADVTSARAEMDALKARLAAEVDGAKQEREQLSKAAAAERETERVDAQKTLHEVRKVLESARDAAKLTATAEHAAIFQAEAHEHKEAARTWLKVTAGLAILTVATAAGLLLWLLVAPPDLTVAQAIQVTAAKVIILSVLLSAVLWASRVYRAHQHNYIVNKHRQNALRTFEAFARGASDPQTKSAVLLEATHSVFAAQTTGYAEAGGDEGRPQIMEIIRGVGGREP